MSIRKYKPYFSLTLVSLAALSLAACQTTQSSPLKTDREAKIDSALERAAFSAAASGEKHQSIGYLEKIYKRNTSSAEAAMNYAHALRKSGFLERASLVLASFANSEDSPSAAKSEFAAILLAQGNNKAAEEYAKKAVLQDYKNHKAYHYLGIALDAEGEHEKAERAFRKGLDHWQGDPTSIMNNLALNLTAQGYLDEAYEILTKAKMIAPDKLEIERNLRIVKTLQQSHLGNTPKPKEKPVLPVDNEEL